MPGPPQRLGRRRKPPLARGGRSTEPPAATPLDDVISALQDSHARLVKALTTLTNAELSGPSYDDGWTIAQVASHLGSGAGIFVLFINTSLSNEPAPGGDQFKRSGVAGTRSKPSNNRPLDRGQSAISRQGARYLRATESWRLELSGNTQSLLSLLRLRLSEQALHTWDIAVARDPQAVVAADAVALIVDNLEQITQRSGKGTDYSGVIDVQTENPDRRFALTLGTDGAHLTAARPAPADSPTSTASLRLPAEAFVRLVYGRLDEHHTPTDVQLAGIDLRTLRATFTGI